MNINPIPAGGGGGGHIVSAPVVFFIEISGNAYFNSKLGHFS